MSALLRSLLDPLVHIKREEWTKTILMFFYFYLTITSYYILKPVRDSIFLEDHGVEKLPYVWLMTIVVLTAVVSVYVRVVNMVEKNVLLSSTVVFFITNLGVFWWLSYYQAKWISVAFFIWTSIFSVMVVTQFWLYATDIFNSQEAKRLFGFVGSGGLLGAMTGGALTKALVQVVGTRNLILIAAFLLLFCVLLINIIWELERKKGVFHVAADWKEKIEKDRLVLASVKMIFEKRYLLLIVGLVFITKMVSTLVEYQFKAVVALEVLGVDNKTAFFGGFYYWMNLISVIVQLLLTSFILRRYGVGVALFLLPVGLVAGFTGILLHPVLWTAAATALYEGSLSYGLNQTSKEYLYLPLFSEIRYRVKPFIDTVGYRLAKGMGSVLILFFVNFLKFNITILSVVSLGFIAIWLVLVYAVRKEHVNALREFLDAQAKELEEPAFANSDEPLLRAFFETLSSEKKRKALLALRAYNQVLKPGFAEEFLCKEPGELKKVLHEKIMEQSGLDLNKEIKRFLAYASFAESREGLLFINRVLYGANSAAEGASPGAVLAGACWSFLSGEAGAAEEISQWRQKWGSPQQALLEQAMSRISQAHPHYSVKREAVAEMLKQLSATGSLEGTSLEKVRRTISENHMVPVLVFLLEQELLPAVCRRNLAQLLAGFNHPDTLMLLYGMLDEQDGLTRNHAVHALAESRLHAPGWFADHAVIRRAIDAEVSTAEKMRSLMGFYVAHKMSRESSGETDMEKNFMSAQQQCYHEIVDRILHLLALSADAKDAKVIISALQQKNETVKANAIELLEHHIADRNLKLKILELLSRGLLQGEKTKPFWKFTGIDNKHVWNDLLADQNVWIFLSAFILANDFRQQDKAPLPAPANALLQQAVSIFFSEPHVNI